VSGSPAAKDPGFAERVRRSFAAQPMMATIGALLERVEPGAVDIALPVAPHIRQQHGFVHAGAVSTVADTACGFAALTLMPAGAGVLTTEFKINLMAPAAGERLLARGRVIRSGRTLIVTQAEVFAEAGGASRLIALMTATMMTIEGRDGIVD
jgi:uncharacterized protein (TIGR00369 family)